jgi:outer membrane protein OmpA-like peptidoglycan-associated protein
MEHGIASTRIRAKGLGESRPVASNRKLAGRKKNRRVEIIIHRAN